MDTETKEMTFDVVMSFDVVLKEAYETLCKEVQEAFPEYEFFYE